MVIIQIPPPTHRDCAWCAQPVAVVRRPGRPRIYCNHACRQRAYEHRHGFCHQRTPRALPGQHPGDSWGGTGYERSVVSAVIGRGRVHAMRTSVRPEGRRRETLCGALAAPLSGQFFSDVHSRACTTCSNVAASHPLRHGISASNELSRLRAIIDEITEHRLEPQAAVRWLQADGQLSEA